ncbi:MAG: hypothetical protein EBY04_03410 [Actinobacteria bacterium]|nr:hypothetical protein [Actinomycetota bacterium]
MAPVAAGIAFFAVLGLVLFGIAALMSGEQSQTTTFTPDRLQVGNVERWADTVNTNGPVLFPGLGTTSGERTIVLDHNGSDPQRGWIVYYAYPADRDPSCIVTHVKGTRDFIDCDQRTLAVELLHRPVDARPVVENRASLLIDLRAP